MNQITLCVDFCTVYVFPLSLFVDFITVFINQATQFHLKVDGYQPCNSFSILDPSYWPLLVVIFLSSMLIDLLFYYNIVRGVERVLLM